MNFAHEKRILSLKSPPVFDREHAPAWRTQALEALSAGQVYCEIDMESTEQMDSVGLASLLSIREMVEKRTGHVRLVNPSSAITQLLEVTRMHRYFEIATFRFESPLVDQRPILVIEDEPHIRTVTELVVKPLGRPVISAGDGEEGIKAAIRHHPAAILLDYLMPVAGSMTSWVAGPGCHWPSNNLSAHSAGGRNVWVVIAGTPCIVCIDIGYPRPAVAY